MSNRKPTMSSIFEKDKKERKERKSSSSSSRHSSSRSRHSSSSSRSGKSSERISIHRNPLKREVSKKTTHSSGSSSSSSSRRRRPTTTVAAAVASRKARKGETKRAAPKASAPSRRLKKSHRNLTQEIRKKTDLELEQELQNYMRGVSAGSVAPAATSAIASTVSVPDQSMAAANPDAFGNVDIQM